MVLCVSLKNNNATCVCVSSESEAETMKNFFFCLPAPVVDCGRSRSFFVAGFAKIGYGVGKSYVDRDLNSLAVLA